ncbi:MAG: DUF928 domain-containing protein [Phormidesmis sp.]
MMGLTRQVCCMGLCLGSIVSFVPRPLQSVSAALVSTQRNQNNEIHLQATHLQATYFEQISQARRKPRRRGRYRSPDNVRIPQQDHSGGGVRGCGEEVVAMAPRVSSIGQTAVTHPTFVWYSQSDSADPLELQLYRYRSGLSAANDLERVFIRQVDDSRKGYMSYTLPADQPGLKVGEIYLWQVVLYCDPNREEVGMWTSADMEVVSASSETVLATLENVAGNTLENAQIFAENGLWYEAIAAVYGANTSAEANLRRTLLQDLIELESEVEANQIEEIVDQLQRVSEMN